MSELVSSNVGSMLCRVTLVLLAGWLVMLTLRTRMPSISLAIARCVFVASCCGPICVLSGWSLPVSVLPATNDPQPLVSEINANESVARQVVELAASTPVDQPGTQTLLDEITRPSMAHVPSEVPAITEGAHGSATKIDIDTVAAVPPSAATSLERVQSAAFNAWILGFVVLLIRFMGRVRRTQVVIQRSRPCDEAMQEKLVMVAKRLGIKGQVRVRLSDDVTGPCTVGWHAPVVLLPTSWTDDLDPINESQFEMILGHELSHVSGQDTRWDAFGQVMVAVWWFHPLVSMIAKGHRLACEHRCDAAASRIAGNAESYRRQLAKWALAIRSVDSDKDPTRVRHDSLASFPMAERPLLLKRLSWLKRDNIHEANTRRRRFIAVLSVGVVALACLSIKPVPRATAAPNQRPPIVIQPKETAEPEKVETERSNTLIASETVMGYFGNSRPVLNWERVVTVAVAVMDEQGDPIPNATVQLGGLTDRQGRDGYFALEGGAATDDRGGAVLELPGGLRSFRLRVRAEGYAAADSDLHNIAERIEIRMKRGRVVRVRATNEEGELLSDAMPMVEDSNIFGREFENDGKGVHTSPVLAPERRWMWVVDGSDASAPILFSDLIDLADETTVNEAGIRPVVLRAGVRLEGTLGPEVPRPIKNGFVHVAIRDGENHRIEQFNRGGIAWHEHTEIEADGTFVFESLPRDTHAQIFAICDGWQSSSPTKASVQRYFEKHNAGTQKKIDETMDRYNSNPQLFHLAAESSPVSITLSCRKTTALDVRVVDPVGQPVPKASVSMSPNLAFFGDLVIPGVQMWSNQMVRGSGVLPFATDNAFAQFAADSFLDVTTDANGIARIRNLPNLSDSFEVEASGYVMSAYPTTDAEKPGRYGLTGDMIPGKITKRTVTMERDLKPTIREVMVVDQDGNPLKDIELTITAIATGAETPDWHQWSVRRFGEASRKRTGDDGLAKLLHPQVLEGGSVRLLAIRLEGRITRHRSLNSAVVIPAKPDGHGFRVTANAPTKAEDTAKRWKAATVEYTDILSSNGTSKSEILRRLLERSDLLSLRQLLAANDFNALTPMQMNPNANRSRLRNRPASEQVTTPSGERVIVLAKAHPADSQIALDTDPRSLKEVAFIFDTDGNLSGVLGGSETDGSSVTFTNLGGTFNHFVWVSGFEQHGDYEYVSRWYKVDEPAAPALTVFHQANSASYAAFQGTKFPRAEYGFLGFGLNGVKLPNNASGKNDAGADVPMTLVWDRRKEKFVGELSQSHDGRPVYRVIPEKSDRFTPVATKSNEITVIGGRRDFQNWHLWTVVVPNGDSRNAKLELRDASGNTTRVILERVLEPGQHNLQLLFEDAQREDTQREDGENVDEEQTGRDTRTRLVVLVDADNIRKDRKTYEVPHFTVTEEPTLKGQGNYITGKPPLRFIEKQSTDRSHQLVWVIE